MSFYITIHKKNPGISKYILMNRDKKVGDVLLSHITAVPSAQTGLTSLFGMGRGGTPVL